MSTTGRFDLVTIFLLSWSSHLTNQFSIDTLFFQSISSCRGDLCFWAEMSSGTLHAYVMRGCVNINGTGPNLMKVFLFSLFAIPCLLQLREKTLVQTGWTVFDTEHFALCDFDFCNGDTVCEEDSLICTVSFPGEHQRDRHSSSLLAELGEGRSGRKRESESVLVPVLSVFSISRDNRHV